MNREATGPLTNRIATILRDFDASLRRSKDVDLRPWLEPWQGPSRAALFRLLLSQVVRDAHRSGSAPSLEDFQQQFPEYRPIVHELFNQASELDDTRSFLLLDATEEFPADDACRDAPSEQGGWPAVAGRYQILGEIARGGMGAVLRAHDPGLSRPVAIKVMLPGIEKSREAVSRFWQEARITAQLQHPGLPPMHDVGTLPNGSPFFAMKLIEGNSLASLLSNRRHPRDDLPRFVAIFENICQAVAYAHTQGVIHRDLKPANVMVGGFGEVQVMDWGLAKCLRQLPRLPLPVPEAANSFDHEVSRDGYVAGTPGFMPPEQACGLNQIVDERADVFGLAAILCVILTGRPPYVGATKAELLARCCRGDLSEAYRELDSCEAAADLIAIARRGLASDTDHRQRDARVMVNEVRGYRESVERLLQETRLAQAAAAARVAERRKRRIVWGMFTAAAVLAAGLIGLAGWRSYRERRDFNASAQVALKLTGDQLDLAREASADPDRMGTLLQVSRARLSDLDAQSRSAGLELDDGSGTRRASLERELDAAYRDQAALAAFQSSRRLATRIQSEQGTYLDQEALVKLWTDLDELGFSPKTIPAPKFAASLRDRHPKLKRELTSLLEFLLAASSEPEQLEWVLATLTLLEDRPDRRELLEAVGRRDVARITAAAERLAPQDYSPEFLFSMAQRMPDSPLRMLLLRKARFAWPNDFWLNHLLGVATQSAATAPENRANTELVNALHVESISCLNAAAALEPDNVGNLVNLGISISRWGDVPQALKTFTRALEIDPSYGAAHVMRGVALMQLNQREEGVASFETSIRVAPSFAPAYSYLARWHAQNSRWAEAISLLRTQVELSPTAEAHFELGKALGASERYDDALVVWTKATALDPNHALAHHAIGLAHIDKGQLAQAIESLENARRCDPESIESLYDLGTACFRAGQLDRASQCWLEVVAKDDNRGEAHAQLGIVLFQLGNRSDGVNHLLKAHQLGEGTPNTRVHLAAELAGLGRVDEAMTACRDALRIDPNFSNAWFTLSELQAFRGEVDDALESLRRVAEIPDPLKPTPAALEAQQARYEQARAWKSQQAVLTLTSEFPTDANLLTELARISENWHGQHHMATRLLHKRFSPEVVASSPIMPTERFFAACCAAQAAASLHHDERIAPQDSDRSACRRLALEWISGELALWRELVPSVPAEARRSMRDSLDHWISTPELTPVRDPAGLALLPPAEREPWEAFWQSTRMFRDEIAASFKPRSPGTP